MKATVSANGQIVIPAKVRKALALQGGSVLGVTVEGKTVVLRPLEPPPPQKPDPVKFIRKNGFLVAVTKRSPTPEQIKAALADFP